MLQAYLHSPYEAGTDEAGRGCLAGPVTAAAIILEPDFSHKTLNDSKLLTERQRKQIQPLLEEAALAYAVAHVFPETIDKINILNASIKAMHMALDQLAHIPEYILVDGNRFKPYENIPHTCVVKGDGKFLHIAAASVLAKTARDAYMEQIHLEYPMYQWINNKGYPTKAHREAIRKYGPCEYHRKSFRLLPEQLELEF
ncbi:ribonuclease HII [Lentiprolixibacter aurantiacus]|uniref:Ribonuclease HII n=1 Tax=Lentiprolixibacter aurantiacus TaxID=2993939 RepID=A0AAE3SM18_9FLAO|nr:ribonuclease HII [Lentiprolixibacter aurantiacus]MCX2717975.1 ribonuclease HII [Lentiprolixibacter aurantiacus]